MSSVILIFARPPVAGACKTRLIPRYGPRGAARIYRRLLERTVRVALQADADDVELWVAGNSAHPEFLRLRRNFPKLKLRRQFGSNLGQRMARALNQSLMAGYEQAVLMGTDAVDIEPVDVFDALESLQIKGFNAVLQPSEDGGFVLIGTMAQLGQALCGVAWSSGRELAQTRKRLMGRGLKLAMLRTRVDIDHPADWRKAQQQLRR